MSLRDVVSVVEICLSISPFSGDLLSFPTRRSSDLRQYGERARRVGLGLVALGLRPRDVVSIIAENGPDRKSTRLNSSHTVISYAVFCLKKKNTHGAVWRARRISTARRSSMVL